MGVRGLTTFVAANADKYLKSYHLHDTYLVIDGNNLAAHLYKWHAKCYDCFGGDYDKYAKNITYFFKVLHECNVTPLIIFDGGYEDRKIKTVYDRIKGRYKQAKQLTAATEGTVTVFPLFLRELFVEILIKLQLKVVRCTFEADYEMACIARKLCCPLLSYDSDFYIFDVSYIPFSTLDIKTVKVKNKTTGGTYSIIRCQIYKIENLIHTFGGLKVETVPLLGVLLGNDYINSSVFKSFYEHIKLPKRKYAETDNQRRIAAVFKWLQNETYESAVTKILQRIKLSCRKTVANQIKLITEGYLCSESTCLHYLNVNFTITNEDQESNEGSNSEICITPNAFDANYTNLPNLPGLFCENYKKCVYPACFMDIICNNRYIFTPQVENYLNVPSHTISLNVLAAIYKILSLNNSDKLTYFLRNTNASMQNYILERSSKELPCFEEIQKLASEQRQQLLLEVLEVNNEVIEILSELPVSWRLYILCVIYWAKNVKPIISTCHLYTVILSAIAIKVTNSCLTYCKVESKFLSKYHNKIQEVIKAKPIQLSSSNKNVEVSLNAITENDCIMLVKEIISNFHMDIKLRKNPKVFDICIIDSFAQLQSCALHIKYLNTVLNHAFEDYLISDFYNGTLMYNFCTNFKSRTELDCYIHLLLQYCPSILQSFKGIKNLLTTVLHNNITIKIVNKKKRKIKPKEKVFSEYQEISEEETHLCDVNNRFSLLNLLNSSVISADTNC